jgi:hypothetical protein
VKGCAMQFSGLRGTAHLRQVVKRLGYGLDKNALAAAQRMRLCPDVGTLNGYDGAALVRIMSNFLNK